MDFFSVLALRGGLAVAIRDTLHQERALLPDRPRRGASPAVSQRGAPSERWRAVQNAGEAARTEAHRRPVSARIGLVCRPKVRYGLPRPYDRGNRRHLGDLARPPPPGA